ncbi:ankyrin repeat plant-like protein [Trifolium medium]|uniref:Ankyrin repeat plant-like protein n=1 Tax=Trifolium medium TaxID=97028 RepID=A0A392QNP6_9FABA|nr:ankyrin repeat plant-like protein [Trifolium medium]
MATVIATMTFQMALNPPGGVRSINDEANPPSSANANPPNAYAYPPDANNGNPDALSCTLVGYPDSFLCPGYLCGCYQ